jgi:hypothetical protein
LFCSISAVKWAENKLVLFNAIGGPMGPMTSNRGMKIVEENDKVLKYAKCAIELARMENQYTDVRVEAYALYYTKALAFFGNELTKDEKILKAIQMEFEDNLKGEKELRE